MNAGRTVFAQLIDHLPHKEFRALRHSRMPVDSLWAAQSLNMIQEGQPVWVIHIDHP